MAQLSSRTQLHAGALWVLPLLAISVFVGCAGSGTPPSGPDRGSTDAGTTPAEPLSVVTTPGPALVPHASRGGGFTLTRLTNGDVLVVGGYNLNTQAYSAPTLYVQSTNAFRLASGGLLESRSSHTATRLQNGKVLVVGGRTPSQGIMLSSAELYDSATESFTRTGNAVHQRNRHTATLLPDGRVLIAGGEIVLGGRGTITTSAELYDPATGTFVETGAMNHARLGHTATLLSNGKVLMAGGDRSFESMDSGRILDSLEVYDPQTGTFALVGQLSAGRSLHQTYLLPNQTILVAGGGTQTGYGPGGAGASWTADVLDATTFALLSTIPTPQAVYGEASVQRPNGDVVFFGTIRKDVMDGVSVFELQSRAFKPVGLLAAARMNGQAILLDNGKALVLGGNGDVPGTELY